MNIISEYEQILIGNKTQFSPKNFPFEDESNERIILTVFRYAVENLLGWKPEEAYHLFTPEIVKMMKLEPLVKYINFPCELGPENTDYIIHLLYPRKFKYNFRKHVIQVYQRVMSGEIKYPKDFMFGNKGLSRAIICLQYALETSKIFHSTEDMYKFFSTPEGVLFLKEKKLHQLYISFYKSPIDYLHHSLPEYQRNEFFYHFYRFMYRYKQKNRVYPPMTEIPESLNTDSSEEIVSEDDTNQEMSTEKSNEFFKDDEESEE